MPGMLRQLAVPNRRLQESQERSELKQGEKLKR